MRGPILIAMAAFLAVVATLGDPGITIDEPLDVRPGRTYVQTFLKKGLGFFDAATVRAVFADNAEHPPLGRWLLGVASMLGEPFESVLGGADPFGVHAGRLAPAVCLALLVGIAAHVAGRLYGTVAGLGAGVSLLLMPRMFAHAHLAALDTFVALFWTTAYFASERALGAKRPTPAMALAGLFWGLALLTKIHGWLLVPLIGLYALARLGPRRALGPVAAWSCVGLLVFWGGWPWLWYDTWERWRAYLGTGVVRLTLHPLYFGHVYDDRAVPWHYPWFYFAVTVPIGLHLLGMVGVWRTFKDPDQGPGKRLLGAILLFLVLFSTNVPVYDGERLFIPAFPLWAVMIGKGIGTLWESRPQRWARGGLVVLLLLQGHGLVALHPYGLSYYNALVGGLKGAERLGLELTYWSDPIDARLLNELAKELAPGDVVAIVPSLHHIQPAAAMTPALLAKKVRLAPQEERERAAWWVVARRTAYWPPDVAARTEQEGPRFVNSRQGVWLSGAWPGPTAPEKGN